MIKLFVKVNWKYSKFLDIIKTYMSKVQKIIYELSYIAKLYGPLTSVVQSGGGNISIKDNNKMLIKSSGINFSDISSMKELSNLKMGGFSNLFANKMNSKNFNKSIERLIQKNLINKKKPSIETSMHLFLNKYVIHTHPKELLVILSMRNAREILKKIYSQYEFATIRYVAPGIDLAKEIYKKTQGKNKPRIIFLLNHGLIIHHENINDLVELNNEIINISKKMIKSLDCEREISKSYIDLYNSFNNDNAKPIQMIYPSKIDIGKKFKILKSNPALKRHKEIIKKISRESYFPDKVVYCGDNILSTTTKNYLIDIKEYTSKKRRNPKILIMFNESSKRSGQFEVFILAKNLSKAREIEDVFSLHIEIIFQSMATANNQTKELKNKDIEFLVNWDAEKYREGI